MSGDAVPTDCEFVDGRLLPRRRTVASTHLAGTPARLLHGAYGDQPPPWLFGGGVGYRCFSDESGRRVRRPDASAVAGAEWPGGPADATFLTVPPLLAMQVVSARDVPAETVRRAADFVRAGSDAFWIIDPFRRVVDVLRASGRAVYASGEALQLPGTVARLPVADIFPPPPAAAGDAAP